jgi:hypothetical protein
MFTDQEHGVEALGDRVRAASAHRGPWPTISVWHGTSDAIVKPSNGEDIVRQWANVHGLSEKPSYQEFGDNHTRRVWSDENGELLIEAFSISNMAHGVPLATTGRESCGAAGAFFLDVGLSSTHHIARLWRLDEGVREVPHVAVGLKEPNQVSNDSRALVVAGAAVKDLHASAESAEDAEAHDWQAGSPIDPNAVIAAAFKVAGLEIPTVPMGATSSVAPGPIIASALKAAGLMR